MFNTKTLLAASITATMLLPTIASAIPIDAGLSIIGTTILDDDDPDLLSADNSYSADLYSTVGAVTSGAVINVGLTDTGDGFGHTASLAGSDSRLTTLGADYDMTTTNSTANEYSFTFGITFSHSADADGGDLEARARTRLGVENDSTGEEYLYSRLTSESGYDYAADTASWTDQIDDEVGSADLGTNGDLVAFGETRYFSFNLLGGETLDILSEFTLDGRMWDDGASYDMSSSIFIFLDSFENLTDPGTGPGQEVPEPSSLALLMAGLLAVRFARKQA